MLTSDIFRSTSVRLSLVYSGLIVAAFVLVGILIRFAARNTAEAELRQDIELEVTAIETELKSEGLEAAIAAIKARAEHPGAFEYWVTDGAGDRLAGDFPNMDGPSGWHHIAIGGGAAGGQRREDMLILTETLPGGIRLSVGDDLQRARAVQEAVFTTLGSIGGAAVLLCLVVGVLATRRILRRMETLDATLEKVAAGEITARFPARADVTSDVERIGLGVNTMLDRIEELVGDVRRVSRDIAHDLRTPLTHLQQHLEQAKADADAAPPVRIEAIEGAQQKVAEILKVFDALLRLSEIEAGAAKQRFKPVDLAAIVEKVADAYRPDVEELDHHLDITAIEPCEVVGDQDLLAQALANLIENAMRHTPAGTRIEVTVSADHGSPRVEVSDNGRGIPPEARETVLKPFMRLDASRTTPGSGLGLSMVAAIARFHAADLVLEDAQPGLRVSLRFP